MMEKVRDNKKKYFWLLLSLGIAVAFCACFLLAGRIPSWVKWEEKETALESGVGISLGERKLAVTTPDGKEIFTTPDELSVQDFLVTDVDRDGKDDIIALLWKRGKFGKHRPFWVLEDEKDFSQHIFIYEIDGEGKVREKWCASDIGKEINRMKLMERNATVLLAEGRDGECSLWQWESFGLKGIENEVKFIAFGDNIIHDEIMLRANAYEGGSYDFLYEDFLGEIRDADIASLQVESMLIDNEKAVAGYPSFGSPLAVGEAIASAGFDIAVCGGNHALDRGIRGVDVTKSFFEQKDICCIGVQDGSEKEYKPYDVITRNGMKIALFSYTYGTNGNDVSDKYPYAVHYLPTDEEGDENLISELLEAREEVDFVIVYVHWGDEYDTTITDKQHHMAGVFADGKADVVIGTHPHVVQPTVLLERPDGGQTLVYYSLGNFCASQGRMEETKTGAEALFTLEHCFDGVRIKEYETKEINAFVK